MARRPDVVMAQVGDPLAARGVQASIVRTVLAAGVLRQIEPADAGVPERLDHGLAVVGAGVPDNQDLESLQGLSSTERIASLSAALQLKWR